MTALTRKGSCCFPARDLLCLVTSRQIKEQDYGTDMVGTVSHIRHLDLSQEQPSPHNSLWHLSMLNTGMHDQELALCSALLEGF